MMQKYTKGIVRSFKDMRVELTGKVTDEGNQLLLENKKINDIFRELLGNDIEMKIRETKNRDRKWSFCNRYNYGVIEDGKLEHNLFFENGGGRRSVTDTFRRFIGREIDIKIEWHPPHLRLLRTHFDDDCCCWD